MIVQECFLSELKIYGQAAILRSIFTQTYLKFLSIRRSEFLNLTENLREKRAFLNNLTIIIYIYIYINVIFNRKNKKIILLINIIFATLKYNKRD